MIEDIYLMVGYGVCWGFILMKEEVEFWIFVVWGSLECDMYK